MIGCRCCFCSNKIVGWLLWLVWLVGRSVGWLVGCLSVCLFVCLFVVSAAVVAVVADVADVFTVSNNCCWVAVGSCYLLSQ